MTFISSLTDWLVDTTCFTSMDSEQHVFGFSWRIRNIYFFFSLKPFFLDSLCTSSYVNFVIYCPTLPLFAANIRLRGWLEHREVSV